MPRKRLLPLSQTEGFLTDETQRAKYISRILKPLEHFYFYISYTCVECGKDMMSYFASSWKKKNRGMFSANRTKHLILDLVKFNPGKFFIPCLLKSTDKRLFVLLVFSVFVELFSSFVWDCLFIPFLTLHFPEVEQTYRVQLSEHHGFRTLFNQNKHAKGIKGENLPPYIDAGSKETLWQFRLLFTTLFYVSYLLHILQSSSWTSALRVSVIRVQNLLVSDEQTSESFLPWTSAENL